MEEEYEVITIEELVNNALVEVDRQIAELEPGCEARERLNKERDSLLQRWIEIQKQACELTEHEKSKKDSKFKKVLECVKTGGEFVWKGVQVVGSLGLALAMFRFSKGGDFMTADETRSVGWLESLLTKNV